MFIVGLTGGIGHGKTTFADLLAGLSDNAQEWESSTIIIDVANAWRKKLKKAPRSQDIVGINDWVALLPAVLQEQVHCQTTFATIELTPLRLSAAPELYQKLFEYLALVQTDPPSHKQAINLNNKSFYRPLLQWLGGYLAIQVDNGIWFDEILRQIAAAQALELALVGGVRFPADADRIKAAGGLVVSLERKVAGVIDAQDITERERTAIEPDVIIANDGSMAQLVRCARAFWADLLAGKPAAKYKATTY